jgi:hypothetical protein
MDELHVEIVENGLPTALATHAGIVNAAEGRFGMGDHEVVDAYHTGVQSAAERFGTEYRGLRSLGRSDASISYALTVATLCETIALHVIRRTR